MEWVGDIVPEGTWTTSCFLTSTSTMSLALQISLVPQNVETALALYVEEASVPNPVQFIVM